MNFSFRYNKTTKKHTIEASSKILTVSVTKELCSGLTETLETLKVGIGNKKEIETNIVNKGVYTIKVESSTETVSIPYSSDLDILSSFSDQVKEIFCNQSSFCGNCRKLDKSSMCSLLLSAFSKSQVLIERTSIPVSTYQKSVKKDLNCESVELLNCSMENEYLTGDFNYSKELIKRLIAYDYLSFYLALTDENNNFLYYPVEEMLEAMNHKEVLCCIENNSGVSVTNIINQTGSE